MGTGDDAAEPVADREVVITRTIDAPAHIVFEAYATPERLMKWFGPTGWPLTMCEMDFRVGGRLRLAMTGPDGVQGPAFGGKYLEIVPNRKIVYDNAFELPDAERFVITITFEEVEARTKLTVHTLFATVADKKKYADMGYLEGVGSGLDQLAELARAMRGDGTSRT